MKLHVVLIAGLVSASVDAESTKCKAATYRCERNQRAWDVCNTSGEWVFAGHCPPRTACKMSPANGSPYCLPRTMNAVEL
ncbi:hypothetical protein MY3296_010204 [Beauveria thailandica]